ncbi:acyl carrier protein [Halomonas sp. BC04]|uniref:acyl carrier protein n=1 Tax=Halomonas sp. BC04 TaxID=1403540 RepID=UPI0003ED6BA9|nr:acyl carrier protein [Halomonas sp. BC04]EWG98704.1 phosphopantetheine-binding protein [Halomonas sp. BC04]
MNRDQLRAIVLEELSAIAPDIDIAHLDDEARLRDEYDLDSMDALNLLTAVHQRLGVNIPEREYARMHSLQALLDYLEPRLDQ